jgi:hypothetical protein
LRQRESSKWILVLFSPGWLPEKHFIAYNYHRCFESYILYFYAVFWEERHIWALYIKEKQVKILYFSVIVCLILIMV